MLEVDRKRRNRAWRRPPYRAEQRNQIFACFINAASELMEDEGMEALTLRCVAKRAGYNSATLYNYFKDLDHLTVYASMKYFEDYNRNLARYLADEQDPLQRFLFMWRFFCASAFRHPRAYYNLFYGKYSGELGGGSIPGPITRCFPMNWVSWTAACWRCWPAALLTERNWQMLRPVLEGEDFTPEEQEEINEIILYCFKELLTQKLQAGDTLNDQALIERQLSYIHVILRR